MDMGIITTTRVMGTMSMGTMITRTHIEQPPTPTKIGVKHHREWV
jgi:hypothetical protein